MQKAHRLKRFESGIHFFELEEDVVAEFVAHKQKRLFCRLNDQIDIHCALLNSKLFGYYIIVGTAVCKSLKIKTGDEVTLELFADNSTYQFEMPEELEEVLATDPEASQIFEKLRPGNQRGLIQLVLQLKSTDKRIERALLISEKMKCGVTSPRLILKRI